MMADSNGNSIIDRVMQEMALLAKKQEDLDYIDAKRLSEMKIQLEYLKHQISALKIEYHQTDK